MHGLLSPVVEALHSPPYAGGRLACERRRLPGERRPDGRARCDLLDDPLQLGALDHLVGDVGDDAALERARDEPLDAGGAGSRRRARLSGQFLLERRLELRARQHLLGDALDDMPLDERAGDGFRQRAGKGAVDGAFRLR